MNNNESQPVPKNHDPIGNQNDIRMPKFESCTSTLGRDIKVQKMRENRNLAKLSTSKLIAKILMELKHILEYELSDRVI
eukprot:PDM66758.1 hypothetical protein PRIPAC_48175 [Pristionchus pacificus]